MPQFLPLFYVPETLQSAGFVDNPLEEPFHRRVVERARIHLLNVGQDFRLPGRLVNVQTQRLLLVSNRKRALRPHVQQPDELGVDFVDPLSQLVDPFQRGCLSHRT